jgi:hypothetical protein
LIYFKSIFQKAGFLESGNKNNEGMFIKLPKEIFELITEYLEPDEKELLARTCKKFREIINTLRRCRKAGLWGYPAPQCTKLNIKYFTQNINLLKYAHENGCEWNANTCHYEALSENLECLKYAHEHECPWDEIICRNAAKNGNIECLKYAHVNGCPWDGWTCYYASCNGHLECLKYAHENGCP